MTLNRWLILSVLSLLILAGLHTMVSAQVSSQGPLTLQSDSETNNASVHDLVWFVSEAVVYSQRQGKEQALHEFSDPNGSFTKGERYIWAYDYNCTNLAHPYHPEYKGTNKSDLTDPSGFRMIEAMRNAALNGSGFVQYQYENPVSGLIEDKLSYVKRVDDSWWIASGIYGQNYTIPPDTPESVRDMLIGLVDEAIQYSGEVGSDAALAVFNNQTGQFTTNDTYIFGFDINGTTLAHPFHPDRIGINESSLTDPNNVSIGQEKLRIAKDGGGFLYYVYNDPDAGGKPELKISYVKPAGGSLVLGTGVYLQDIAASFQADSREKITSQVKKAVSYIREQGREAAIIEFNDPNGSFSDPHMFVFLMDTNGTLLANPFIPGLIGLNRLNDRDPYGKYPVQQFIRDAERGGGYSYYFFADPDAEYAIKLKLAYVEPAGDDLIVGSGIFSDT